MAKPDLSTCTYAELNELRAEVHNKMAEMREQGITQLRATIQEQAALLGLDAKDLIPAKQRKKRRSRQEIEAAKQ